MRDKWQQQGRVRKEPGCQEGKEHRELWSTVWTEWNDKNVSFFPSSDLSSKLEKQSCQCLTVEQLNNCHVISSASLSLTSADSVHFCES